MGYVSLHDILDWRSDRCLALQRDIPRIVSLRYDTNQLSIVHDKQRADVFVSHFCNGIAYRCVRTNSPQAPALSFKKMSYGHGAAPFFSLSVASSATRWRSSNCVAARMVLSSIIQAATTNPPRNRATVPRSTQELELCQTH